MEPLFCVLVTWSSSIFSLVAPPLFWSVCSILPYPAWGLNAIGKGSRDLYVNGWNGNQTFIWTPYLFITQLSLIRKWKNRRTLVAILPPTCIISKSSLVSVKNKPPFFPCFNFSSHFNQKASAGLLSERNVVTGLYVVPSCFDVTS